MIVTIADVFDFKDTNARLVAARVIHEAHPGQLDKLMDAMESPRTPEEYRAQLSRVLDEVILAQDDAVGGERRLALHLEEWRSADSISKMATARALTLLTERA